MLKLEYSKEKVELYFLIFYFSVSPISKLLEKIGIPRELVYIVLVLACCVYIANRYNVSKIRIDVFIAYLILIPITAYAVAVHYNDFNSSNEMYSMLLIFFPAYLIIRVCNLDLLIKALRISGYIGIAIYLPNAFLIENIRAQYMTYAYDVLFPLCIIVFFALKEKKLYDIAISIFGTICLAIFGCRGALLTLGLFFLFIIFEHLSFLRTVILGTVLGIVYYAYTNLTSIVKMLDAVGISSYALTRIANGQMFQSVARSELYDYIFNTLLPNHYLGYGPMGNRTYMPVISNTKQPYPHDIFLEILLDYGLILGAVFSVVIILVVVYMLVKTKGKYRFLVGAFCIACFFPLLISGTFYAKGTIPYIFALWAKLYLDNENENEFIREDRLYRRQFDIGS